MQAYEVILSYPQRVLRCHDNLLVVTDLHTIS